MNSIDNSAESLGDQIHRMAERQQKDWRKLKDALEQMKGIKQKHLNHGSYSTIIQLNPGRIASSTAKTDKESVSRRPCFLCPGSLPPEQEAIHWNNHYRILCNPSPITRGHLTIIHNEHIPQQIAPHFRELLNLSRALEGRYCLVYNGPESGASAPDHFHFQALPSGLLPLEAEVISGTGFRPLPENRGLIEGLFIPTKDDRSLLLLTGTEASRISENFERIYHVLRDFLPGQDEPRVNLLAFYHNDTWYASISLREKHRPNLYFKEGEERLIVSPGAVDMAGILITLREQDYIRMTPDFVGALYREVSLPEKKFAELLSRLEGCYTT